MWDTMDKKQMLQKIHTDEGYKSQINGINQIDLQQDRRRKLPQTMERYTLTDTRNTEYQTGTISKVPTAYHS